MSQINLNADPKFLRDLARLMKAKGIRHKSEAIRLAVGEAARRLERRPDPSTIDGLLGLGTSAPLNPNPKFRSRRDLWETRR
ncbi:MAG: hypothetical protein AABZ30_14465 [Myxococcota bacterium]